MQDQELSALRAQIDSIDEELVSVLARRFRVTEAIGRLKAAQGLNAVDPAREAMQEQRLAKLALHHSVSPTVVAKVFRAIVEEVVSTHKAIAKQAGKPGLSRDRSSLGTDHQE